MRNMFENSTLEGLKSFVTNAKPEQLTTLNLNDIFTCKAFTGILYDDQKKFFIFFSEKITKHNNIKLEKDVYQVIKSNINLEAQYIQEIYRGAFIKAVQTRDLKTIEYWIINELVSFEDFLQVKHFTKIDEPKTPESMGIWENLYRTVKGNYYELYNKLPKNNDFLRLNQLFIKIHPQTLDSSLVHEISNGIPDPQEMLFRTRVGEAFEVEDMNWLGNLTNSFSEDYELLRSMQKFSRAVWLEYKAHHICYQIPAFIMLDTIYKHIGLNLGEPQNADYIVTLEFLRDCPRNYMQLVYQGQKILKVKELIIKTRVLFFNLASGTLIDTKSEDLFKTSDKAEVKRIYNFITANGEFMNVFNEYLLRTKPEIAKLNVKYIVTNFEESKKKITESYQKFLNDNFLNIWSYEEKNFSAYKDLIRKNAIFAFLEDEKITNLYDFFDNVRCKEMQEFVLSVNPHIGKGKLKNPQTQSKPEELLI